MRPRHKAAETRFLILAGLPGVLGASMRPRHKAAETRRLARDGVELSMASMRPRHKAAETFRRHSTTELNLNELQ